MSAPPASLHVAIVDETAYLRVDGRANFIVGVDFKTIFESLIGKGYRRFAIDLRDCPIMDSTFMGLLTGFGMQLPPGVKDGRTVGISLHHANERVISLLNNLGVAQLFLAFSDGNGIPHNLQGEVATPGAHSHEEVQRTCLKAHEILMEANPDNVPKFKDVARFLAEDLAKTSSGSSSS